MSDSKTTFPLSSEASDRVASSSTGGNGNDNEDEFGDDEPFTISKEELIQAWNDAGISQHSQDASRYILGYTVQQHFDDFEAQDARKAFEEGLPDFQRWSLDKYIEEVGTEGIHYTAHHNDCIETEEVRRAADLVFELQGRKGKEAAVTISAAETIVAQGELLEGTQQSDQSLGEAHE